MEIETIILAIPGIIFILLGMVLLKGTIYFVNNSKVLIGKIINFKASGENRCFPVVEFFDEDILQKKQLEIKIANVDWSRKHKIGDNIEIRYCRDIKIHKVRINNLFGIWGGVIGSFFIGIAFCVFGIIHYIN